MRRVDVNRRVSITPLTSSLMIVVPLHSANFPTLSTWLSGSTALRELHLAENKISDVEGLHRLLKPTWRVPTL
uniref:U2A'/phosphoprotein 32 family A C-terminal domain-containing protein n=1 Tax=Oryza barthii TaxID=65489 RepID=A0A0D3G9F5_9ORYZ